MVCLLGLECVSADIQMVKERSFYQTPEKGLKETNTQHDQEDHLIWNSTGLGIDHVPFSDSFHPPSQGLQSLSHRTSRPSDMRLDRPVRTGNKVGEDTLRKHTR
jgi:hypothetical protein